MNFILVGEICSGKDTFAELLPHFHRLAFGDEIGLVCRNLRINGVRGAYLQLAKLFEVTPVNLLRNLEIFSRISKDCGKERKLKQELGTWCREQDNNIWIRRVQQQCKDNIVITDCRRKSEFDAFPNYISVFIDATLETRMERLKERDGVVDISMFQHKAEREIQSLRSRCDFIVENNGTREELQEKIQEVLKYASMHTEPNI